MPGASVASSSGLELVDDDVVVADEFESASSSPAASALTSLSAARKKSSVELSTCRSGTPFTRSGSGGCRGDRGNRS